jgi:hypothetical protein
VSKYVKNRVSSFKFQVQRTEKKEDGCPWRVLSWRCG